MAIFILPGTSTLTAEINIYEEFLYSSPHCSVSFISSVIQGQVIKAVDKIYSFLTSLALFYHVGNDE